MTVRLDGVSDKLGPTTLSDEFLTWEISRPGGDYEDQERMLGALSIGVVLDSSKYFMIPERGVHATFIEQDDLELGREESRHAVRFGQLLLNGPGIHEIPDLVAIKSFDDRESLYNEWASSAYANSLFTEQRAFMNLGVAKSIEGLSSLITLYEHGVKTHDTIFWADRDLQPEALRKDVLKKTADVCMYGLGLMHGARMIHGDAQVKNLGSDARHIRFIDLEGSELIPAEGVDADEYTTKIIRDISVFISSMLQVEENRDAILDAIKDPEVIDSMMDNYKQGIDKARRQQEKDNIYIPDYSTILNDQIREIIARYLR